MIYIQQITKVINLLYSSWCNNNYMNLSFVQLHDDQHDDDCKKNEHNNIHEELNTNVSPSHWVGLWFGLIQSLADIFVLSLAKCIPYRPADSFSISGRPIISLCCLMFIESSLPFDSFALFCESDRPFPRSCLKLFALTFLCCSNFDIMILK